MACACETAGEAAPRRCERRRSKAAGPPVPVAARAVLDVTVTPATLGGLTCGKMRDGNVTGGLVVSAGVDLPTVCRVTN